MGAFEPLDAAQLATPAPAAAPTDPRLPELQPRPPLSPGSEAEQARQQGLQEGRQEARQQALNLLAALQEAQLQSDQQHRLRAAQLEVAACQLAVELAGALADVTLDLAPELIAPVVAGALADLAEAGEVTVHLHPDDLALLDPDTLTRPGQQLHLRPDPQLQRGGCFLASASGDVDATRAGRRDQLRERLTELLERGQ